MEKNFVKYFKNSLSVFFIAIFNLIVFLPYYFSTLTLLKTLFAPWKNYQMKKQSTGFDLSIWFNNLSFNMISRIMGFIIRLSFIFIYFILEVIFILSLPVIFIFYFCLIPLNYILSLLKKPDTTIKAELKDKFMKNHLLRAENQTKVEEWFEEYYKKFVHKKIWWSINSLFTSPPLARDWAMGYTATLDKYSEELTSSIYQPKTKNIINRESEVKAIEAVLLKSEGANVLLVGEEGVGKHTVVDALAKKIHNGKINPLLAYKKILKLNMEKILAEFADLQKREFFLTNLYDEAVDAKNIILLIENFANYITPDKNHLDLSDIFAKYAKSSSLQIIGITTPFAYQKNIYTNSKINEFFNKIDIYEVDSKSAENIILNIIPQFEEYYDLIIPYETIKALIEKSDFFITNIPFPEKAIELLDESCAYLKQKKSDKILLPDFIDIVLSAKTHISTTLTPEVKQKLVNLELLLHKSIVSQDEAIDNIASVLRRSFLLLSKRKKPLSSFLFLGPTGVGKTETAKVLSQVFFGSDKEMLRVDMSLYQSRSDIPKLIGSVDTGEIGILTENIRKNPYGVLLLDEIEKADHDLLNIFLTILDEGYFSDGSGKKVDCKNLMIIATSNAGSDVLYSGSIKSSDLTNYLIEQHIFSPEFLNRFDGIHVYHPLDENSINQIAKKMLDKIIDDIFKIYKVKLNISDATLTNLTKQGYDSKFGARNIERVLRQEIEDKAAKMILGNQVKEGDMISL